MKLLPLLLLLCSPLMAQLNVASLVATYKDEGRGPYRDIRWFCADGEVRTPEEGCDKDEAGNVQHARYKSDVIKLGKQQHLFLAQILTGSDREAFWDAKNDQSRLKQYQLNHYLNAIDDGWILRKARFYRGAIQIEDEMAWGRDFFAWLLADEQAIKEHFYLIRQAARDIPHREDTDLTQSIRAISKRLADEYPDFMNLRVKIHNQPAAEDAAAVQAFLDEHRKELTDQDLDDEAKQLIAEIKMAYGGSDDVAYLLDLLAFVSPESQLAQRVQGFVEQQAYLPNTNNSIDRLPAAAELMLTIRAGLPQEKASDRLALLDISLALEQLIFRHAAEWQPTQAREMSEKICYLSQAAAGAGFMEAWEYNAAAPLLGDLNYRYVWPSTLSAYLDNARRVVEWGTATNRATYGDVVAQYAAFEPNAISFLDDRIRGSVLLPLGDAVGQLGNWVAANGNLNNRLLDVPNQGQIRGLNPGYASGILHVIEENPEETEVNPTDIFVFATPPAELKPVGGIMTVNEGNMVSHVQLLARNLGIPNAVITDEQFARLKKYNGQRVFYAVSNGGTALMKMASEMNETEQALFAQAERSQQRISVPVEKIRLDVRRILNMREVNSEDSGKLCGPKAANLGQLKALFPENVVEGIVIPFGIFREHLDQPMPGGGGQSYWTFLNDKFAEARQMEEAGNSQEEVEAFTLQQLELLREAILQINLQPSLVKALRDSFLAVFGQPIGKAPVFLRSDTNMEDLPSFTGAGLNLTVFNAVDETKIIQGIKKVWASPYTERSYKWRQRYLLNPENVFPSILIIPSVDVDNSGVMITKGVASGEEDDITVAFSRGAGGAVEGQAAEAYLLDRYGRTTLLSPARERLHRRLPVTGGSVMLPATFDQRILSSQNLADLRQLSEDVERIMPTSPGVDSSGPWDVELGFQNDKMWLFQIRPFVENKRAQSSEYLESISPEQLAGVYLDLEYEL
ncbi:MAG: PEP/pyruvate-binding domain-containing protein [Bacteroidota bacterium]